MLCAWDVEERRKRKRAERARVEVRAGGCGIVELWRWVLGKGKEWEEERDCVLICDEAEDL